MFRNLQPGLYTLQVSADGFKTAAVPGFPVEVNQTVTRAVTLEIGVVTETVEVVAGAEMVQQSSAELGEVISEAAVRDLPLNGRNFTQLMTLTPGATPVSTAQGSGVGSGDGSNTGVPGSTFVKPSFNGQQNRSFIIYQDGIINMDFRSHGYATLPNVDLIQEFKVQSHNDKVEWGGVTGGVVNLVSKSGTNEFRGSAFWFVRNDTFDARDPFTDATSDGPAPFRQNQFGATYGGAIVRNKTFFSGGWEAWRYRKPTQSQGRVPTSEELAGDFSNSIIGQPIFDPFSTTVDEGGNYRRTQFPGNRIPQSVLSSQMTGFFDAFEERPNLADPVFNFINSVSSSDDADTFQVKIDHLLSPKDSVFGRWTYLSRDSVTPRRPEARHRSRDAVPQRRGRVDPHVHTNPHPQCPRRCRAPGHHLRPGSRGGRGRPGSAGLSRCGAVRRTADRSDQPLGHVRVPRRGPAREPRHSTSRATSRRFGAVTRLKIGGQWMAVERLQGNTFQVFRFGDQVTGDPQNPGATGASLASALLGLPSSFNGFLPDDGTIHFRVPTYSFYAQDEWRASSRLTLNYGLRFDYSQPVTILNQGMMGGIDIDRQVWLVGLPSMPGDCSRTGRAPCIPRRRPAPGPHRAGEPRQLPAQPGPRQLGPARRGGLPHRREHRAAGRIRAVLGRTDEQQPVHAAQREHVADVDRLQRQGQRLGEGAQSISDLEGNFPAVLPAPSPWVLDTWSNHPSRKNALSHQWHVELQRQVTEQLMASAAYVGSVNRRGEYAGLGNSATESGPGTPEEVNARRPFPQAGGGTFYSRSIGESSYHALQLKARRRFADGFQMLLSYTWSKSMDNGSSGWFAAENGPGGSSSAQNYHDPDSNRSVSSYNIPHFLSFYSVYELPVGKGGGI